MAHMNRQRQKKFQMDRLYALARQKLEGAHVENFEALYRHGTLKIADAPAMKEIPKMN